jgi:hypothetical protein
MIPQMEFGPGYHKTFESEEKMKEMTQKEHYDAQMLLRG